MKKLFLSLALLASTLTSWAWNGNSWMSEINGNIQMSNLSLPGSHNAATGHASSLGLVQDLNITEQFNTGVRAFDYRVHPSGSNLKMQHGITDCNISFQDAMALAIQCVTNNPTETVFIQMQVENGDGTEPNNFWTLVAAALGGMDESKFIRWKSDLTLDDCRGKVILQSRTKYDEFNGHGDTHWGWINWTNDNNNNVCRMYGSNEDDVIVSDRYNHNGQSDKKGYITNYFTDIKKKRSNVWGICFVSGYNALIATTSDYVTNASYAHPHTIDLINAMLNANDPKPIGSIMMDFAGVAKHSSTTVRGDELVKKVIDLSIAYSEKYYPKTVPAHFVDYKPLQYIENISSPRENAFTTDVIPVTATEICVGFRGNGADASEWQAIFSGRNQHAGTGISLYKNGNNQHLAFFTGSTTGDGDRFMENKWQHDNDFEVIANVRQLTVTVNGETETKSTGNTVTNTTTRCLSFFGNPENDKSFRGRIYHFDIKDDNIDDHYVPAIRKDGVWGYWNQKTGDAERFVLPARGTYNGYNFKGNATSSYLTAQAPQTINVNEATEIPVTVIGRPLDSYTFVCSSRNLQVNGSSVTAVVAGDYAVTLTATDSDGFTWEVPMTITAVDESANQYSEVDYIYYDGVNTDNWNNKSYFDTRYVPNANTVVDVKTKIYDKSKGRWTVIFSGRTAFNNGMSLYQNNNGDAPQWGYFVSNNTEDNAGRLFRNTDYSVNFTKDALTVNGTQIKTKSGITTDNFVGSDQSITLFAGRNDWPLFGEISYFKITESGNVICELVPVVSHDGQKFGFLNKVNNEFVAPNKYDGFHYGIKDNTDKPIITVAESQMEIFMSVSEQAPALTFHNLNAADYSLSYVAVDPDIASVSNTGVVSGVSEGETQILITAKKGSEVWSFKVNVKVNPVPTSLFTDLVNEVAGKTDLLNLPVVNAAYQTAKAVAENPSATTREIAEKYILLRDVYEEAKSAEQNVKHYVATRALANEENIDITSSEALFTPAKNNDDVWKALVELRYTRRRALVEHHTIEYPGSAPANDGEYYLYNVGQRQFLTTGSDWGTHAALNFRGRVIKLHADGDGFRIETPSINNGDGWRELNNRGYMDTGGSIFKFVPVEGKENVFYVVQKSDENRYMAWNPYANTDGATVSKDNNGIMEYPQDETTVGTEELGNHVGNPDAQWILVTKETRDALLAQATKQNPVDATYLVPNAAFNKITRINPWTYTNGPGYWDGGGRHSEFAVESYGSKNFEVSQSINLAPGKYKLSVFGFYRNGSSDAQANADMISKSYLFATVGGQTTSELLPNVLEYADLAPGEGKTFTRNGEQIEFPASIPSAIIWFRLGAYQTTIEFEVTGNEAQSVKLGVKKDGEDNTTGNWTVFTNFTLTYEGPTAEAITIGNTGVATFCSPRNLDFSGSGLKAYVATEEKLAGDVRYIHLEEVTEAPAGTGLLLMADADTYSVPVVDEAQAVGTNYLVGTLTAGTVAASTNGVSNYVLAVRRSEGAEPAFYYVNAPAAIDANKAYLSITNGSLAKRLVIGIDNEDGSTSILGINDEQQESDGAIYNVAGQKVNAAYKGIVIKKGNKVVVK